MKINSDLCVNCGKCTMYCPISAIKKDDGIVNIDFDECCECGNCLRSNICPTNAIYQQELEFPRTVRSILSDPVTPAPGSGIVGRGTEEIKTNDVTGYLKEGWIGVAVEMGRPLTGARFCDVEKVAMAISKYEPEYQQVNPTTQFIVNQKIGKFREEILQEKVISAILEFAIKPEKLLELLKTLEEVSNEIDCVFSLDISSIGNEQGIFPHIEIIEKAGYKMYPNGKINLGLGRANDSIQGNKKEEK